MNPRSFMPAVVFALTLVLLPLSRAAEPEGSSPEASPLSAVAASSASEPPARPFSPPPEGVIPDTPLGEVIRRGEEIFRRTGETAPRFVGNRLACSNCHLDAGRLAGAAPLWAAWVSFPAYREKDHGVDTFAERLQDCFRFSMNGAEPPLGDEALVALEAYSAWLAQGAKVGESPLGRGYPSLAAPAAAPDYARGEQVYARRCALCHGPDGAGQSAGGRTVFPPLWGPYSYNWGAGMTSIETAAGFIKANMPLGLGGSLSDQEAWDVAMFMDSQERPQDPRFTGSVPETRARFHDSPWSMYGRAVNGRLLGSGAGP